MQQYTSKLPLEQFSLVLKRLLNFHEERGLPRQRRDTGNLTHESMLTRRCCNHDSHLGKLFLL